MRAHPVTPYEVTALFVGSMIGAGFASGQEVWQFFARFGPPGVAAALTAGLALGGVGAMVLAGARRTAARSYRDILGSFCPRDVRVALEFVLVPFLVLGTAIMFAGAGALGHEDYRLPFSVGVWATALAVAAVTRRRLRGVLAANAILAPLLCAVVLAVVLATLASGRPGGIEGPGDPGGAVGVAGVAAAALVYVCYNGAIALVALAPLGRGRLRPRAAAGGAMVGGLVLGVLAALVAAAELRLAGVAEREVPLAAAATALGPAWRGSYAAALWAALFTTAIANVLGLQSRLGGGEERREALFGPAVAVAAAALSYFGFTALVVTVYPLLGLAGAAAVAFLARGLLRPPRRRRGRGRPPRPVSAPPPATGPGGAGSPGTPRGRRPARDPRRRSRPPTGARGGPPGAPGSA